MINRSRRSLYRLRAGRQKFLSSLLLVGISGLIIAFFLGFILIAIFSRDLPSPGKLRRQDGFSTTFLDRNDKVIFELYKDQNRVPVKISQISKNLQHATIAIEDKDFYHHQGFSISGVARGFISTIFSELQSKLL
jgi:membrane peptidoglycan carboxypeptidase